MLSVQVCSLISSSAFIPPTLLPLSPSGTCHFPGWVVGVFFPFFILIFMCSFNLLPVLFSSTSEIYLFSCFSVLVILPAPSSKFPFCHVSLFSCSPFTFTDALSFRSCFKALKSGQRLSFLFLCWAGGRLPVEIVPKEEQQPRGDFTLYSNI